MSFTPQQKGAIDLAKRYLVDTIYTSCRVEGLSTTFPDTQRILDNLPVNTTAEVVLFTLNMRDAWKFLLDNLEYPVNLMYIRELNKICGDKLIYGSGELRTTNVRIGGSSYIPPIPVQADVVESLSKIYSTPDIRKRAVLMFCYLAKSQLFIDGNKRVAQLVANKILIEGGVGILQIRPDVLDEFKLRLLEYYEDKSCEIYQFLSKCIIEASPVDYITYNGEDYAVQEIISNLPFSVRSQYSNDKDCAQDYIEAYVNSKK